MCGQGFEKEKKSLGLGLGLAKKIQSELGASRQENATSTTCPSTPDLSNWPGK